MYFLLRSVVFDGTKVDQFSMTFPLPIFFFMVIKIDSSEMCLQGTDKSLLREAPIALACLYISLAPDRLCTYVIKLLFCWHTGKRTGE